MKKNRDFFKALGIEEEKDKTEFQLPKFRTEETKTRDEEQLSIESPHSSLVKQALGREPVLTFRGNKSPIDEDDELFQSDMEQVERVIKQNGLRTSMEQEREEAQRRIEGIKLSKRPKNARSPNGFILRELRLLSLGVLGFGMYALFRFLIDLINS